MRTSLNLVPFVLCTIGLVTICICGCGKDENKKTNAAPVADSPSVYMKDKEFRKQLNDLFVARKKIAAEQYQISEKINALAKDLVEKKQASDLRAAYEKLEKEQNPEWVKLKKELEEVKAKLAANRKETFAVTGKRLAPKPGNK